MPISDEKRKLIAQQVLRLTLKNADAFDLMSSAVQGLVSGSPSKHVVSSVLGFDPNEELPVEDLVAESLLNALAPEDVEEIFRRYAVRKGLKF